MRRQSAAFSGAARGNVSTGLPGARGLGSRPLGARGLGSRPLAFSMLVWLLNGSGLLAACTPSHFDGRVYRRDQVAFRLERVPDRWRRIETSGAALAFRDDETRATVAINGRCGKDADDVPLRSLTQHLFIQFTERDVRDQQLMPLDGREALQTRMIAKLDGVQKYFDVVVLKKDGCVYDFWRIANQPLDPSGFLDFVKGFATIG